MYSLINRGQETAAKGIFAAVGLHAAGDQDDKARQTLEKGLEIMERCGVRFYGGFAQRLLGEIAMKTNPAQVGEPLAAPHFEKSIAIFTRLAEAEAKVHQTTIEQIHFHEVGAMDAIIDVVGAVAGIAALGIQKIFCSPLHLGSGTVECAHGTLPVPAPATAELVKGKPVYSTGDVGELLTPTGAAILTTLASDFGPIPAMSVERIGYGAGTSEPAIPNLLRVMIGQAAEDVKEVKTG